MALRNTDRSYKSKIAIKAAHLPMAAQELAQERSLIVKRVPRIASVNFVATDVKQDEETLKDEGVTANDQGSRPLKRNR